MGRSYDVTVYAKTFLTTVVRVEDADSKEEAEQLAAEQVQDDIGSYDWEESMDLDRDDIDPDMSEAREVEAE